jgi:hypothetical protein
MRLPVRAGRRQGCRLWRGTLAGVGWFGLTLERRCGTPPSAVLPYNRGWGPLQARRLGAAPLSGGTRELGGSSRLLGEAQQTPFYGVESRRGRRCVGNRTGDRGACRSSGAASHPTRLRTSARNFLRGILVQCRCHVHCSGKSGFYSRARWIKTWRRAPGKMFETTFRWDFTKHPKTRVKHAKISRVSERVRHPRGRPRSRTKRSG